MSLLFGDRMGSEPVVIRSDSELVFSCLFSALHSIKEGKLKLKRKCLSMRMKNTVQ